MIKTQMNRRKSPVEMPEEKYSSSGRSRTPRLEITAVSGYYNLFLQFYYPETEKKKKKDAYEILRLLMAHSLAEKYQEEGFRRHQRADFYKVSNTDNNAGFCLCVQWESVNNKREALEIVKYALNYVLTFDPKEHRYANENLESQIRINLNAIKKIAGTIQEEIFTGNGVNFHTEFWNPFD